MLVEQRYLLEGEAPLHLVRKAIPITTIPLQEQLHLDCKSEPLQNLLKLGPGLENITY
jgi:hypothetical protein